MPNYPNIVVLTGAGISAESGLKTFRASDGLWEGFKVEEVCTPEAWHNDSETVQEFYNMRRRQLLDVEPNAAHYALADLEEEWPGEFTIVTQNVDDLHEQAGSKNVIHMHGELKKARCTQTDTVYDWLGDITEADRCECCNEIGTLRPHIVWFGEMPLFMDTIQEKLEACTLFLSIGTSGNVYPAAGFVEMVKHYNQAAHAVEVNLEQTEKHQLFDEHVYGLASEAVPMYCYTILHSAGILNGDA